MDHLNISTNDPCDDIKVPYLVDLYPNLAFDPDNDTFVKYLTRVGFDLSRLRSSTPQRFTNLQTMCILQSWIFFGLSLESASDAGIPLEHSDLIREQLFGVAEGLQVQHCLDTRKMPALLCELERKSQPESCDPEWRQQTGQNLVQRLSLLATFWRSLFRDFESVTFVAKDESLAGNLSTAKRVLLSAAVVSEFFESQASSLWDQANTPVDTGPRYLPDSTRLFPPGLDWIKGRLLWRAGWCSKEVDEFLHKSQKVSRLYTLTFIEQQPRLNHDACAKKRAKACRYDHVNEARYRSKHRPSCARDTCKLWGPEGEALSSLLQTLDAGFTPVIVFEDRDLSSSTPSIKCAQERSRPYVAISHVWQDGLGNVSQNALPLCQLRELQKWVNELYAEDQWPVAFWIDTICVPLDRTYRRKAIKSMYRVYSDADRVLVIEATLLSLNVAQTHPTKLLLATSTNKWVRRLWTLQEAMQAKQLYYRYSDCAWPQAGMLKWYEAELGHVDLNKSSTSVPSTFDMQSILRLIYADAVAGPAWNSITAFYQIQNRRSDPQWANRSTINLLNLANWRRTSRWEDEPFCLSSIMGCSPAVQELIADTKDSERMSVLFKSLTTIPTNILFSLGPRQKQKCFSWLPETFLGRESSTGRAFSLTTLDGDHASTVTPEGLAVTCSGIVIEGKAKYDDVVISFYGTDNHILSFINGSEAEPSFRFRSPTSKRLAAMCFMKADVLKSPKETSDGRHHELNAALLEITGRTEDRLVARFLYAGLITNELDPDMVARMRETQNPLKYHCLPEDQQWLVQ
ncbi:MAG: hypothetical protein Q9159_002057 [Coniocarpon cinnabarinum]